MTITTGSFDLHGSPLYGGNPLPHFRDRTKNKFPVNNGTMLPEELHLFGYESAFRVLPYSIQDRYSRQRKTLTIKHITLENDYLKATFLPEYGGRLYSLFDKTTNEELLFKNEVMQPANLAIRDAWFSGGIEWNIAQLGHTFSTCDKVFFSRVRGIDGCDFLRMYDYERTRGLIWQIDFHLPADAKALSAHVTIINDQPHSVPMYWWTNIAAKEEPGCRVFSGTREVLYIEPASQAEGAEHHFGHGQLPYLPSLAGTDASYPLNFDYANEYFFQNPKSTASPWEAISYKNGQVFFERSTQPLRIRKMFCWGSHSGGRNWCDFLSVPGHGDYVEIQAGLSPTQLHGLDMGENSRITFTQIFSSLQLDTDVCSTMEYEEAEELVANAVETALTANAVQKADAHYQKQALLPCSELLYTGHGWGALENVRRENEKEALLPSHLVFPKASLTSEQKYWLDLIEKGIAPSVSPGDYPAWMTDEKYLPYLVKQHQSKPTDPIPLLLMGTMIYENGHSEEGIDLWKQALSIDRLPILYRNLAYASRQDGRITDAIGYMETISLKEYTSLDFAYLQEYFSLLGTAGQWEKIFDLYHKLPKEYQSKERIYLSACEAAMHLEDWDFLLPAFEKEYASTREGETKITEIWLAYAQAHGISHKELPNNLDLRMFEDR